MLGPCAGAPRGSAGGQPCVQLQSLALTGRLLTQPTGPAARRPCPQAGASGASQLVLLPTEGESFATVSAAIRSNTCSQGDVTLVLERPGSGAQ